MTALVMVIVDQKAGLAMGSLTVKTRRMAATSPVTTTMAETAEEVERRVEVVVILVT